MVSVGGGWDLLINHMRELGNRELGRGFKLL